MTTTSFGIVRDRAEADRVYRQRTDWQALPVVQCAFDPCHQRFRKEFDGQEICRDCMSVADVLAAERPRR